MTVEEAKKSINELKAQGLSDEDIIGAFYSMLAQDKMGMDDFEILCAILGYEIKPEVFEDVPEAQENPDNSENSESSEKSGTSEPSEEEQAMKLFGK